MTNFNKVPWRVGRSIGRTIYAVTGPDYKEHPVLGMMDNPGIAMEAVRAHNSVLRKERQHG